MPSISQTPSIYQIRCVPMSKVYVGSAINPRKRWWSHIHALRKGTHHSSYLQRAWNKYGEDAFVFEIVEPVLFVEDLITREQYWIDTLRAADRRYGFNSTPTAGSSVGVRRTEAQRFRQSEQAKARCADPVVRARMAAQSKAYYADPAVRASISERQKAYWDDPATHVEQSELTKVRHADPAYRKRLSDSAKARWANPVARARMSVQAKARKRKNGRWE